MSNYGIPGWDNSPTMNQRPTATFAAMSEPEPMSYRPFSNLQASTWSASFPVEHLAPVGGPDSSERQLNLNENMPAAWRQGPGSQSCGASTFGGEADVSGWSNFIPSREQYERYITTQASARLAVNTRTRNPMIGGAKGGFVELTFGRLLPPLPIGTSGPEFNDSSTRADLVFNSSGAYPSTADTWC